MNLVAVPAGPDGGDSSAPTPSRSPGARRQRRLACHRGRAPRGRRGDDQPDGLELTVDVVEELGADAYVYGTPADANIVLEGGDDNLAKPFIARVDGRNVPKKGSNIFVYPKGEHLHVFDKETGERL